MADETQFNGEQGADIITETPETNGQTEQPETVEQYVPDIPQLANPLHSRTAHFAFRRGRI